MMKAPSHSTPRYLAPRIRKILAEQGWPISKITGRYSPWGGTQKVSEGFSVRRVGCSKNISISYSEAMRNSRTTDVPSEVKRAKNLEAFTLLRKLGYRVDDMGWIECDYYD